MLLPGLALTRVASSYAETAECSPCHCHHCCASGLYEEKTMSLGPDPLRHGPVQQLSYYHSLEHWVERYQRHFRSLLKRCRMLSLKRIRIAGICTCGGLIILMRSSAGRTQTRSASGPRWRTPRSLSASSSWISHALQAWATSIGKAKAAATKDGLPKGITIPPPPPPPPPPLPPSHLSMMHQSSMD